MNIGFLTNGAGENKILAPRARIKCPRGKNFILAQAIGQESYSYELVIGKSAVTLISRKIDHQGENFCSCPGDTEILALQGKNFHSCPGDEGKIRNSCPLAYY